MEQDNTTDIGGIATDRLRSLIERIERLEEEKAAIASDVRDVFAEAKSAGFDVKIMREIIIFPPTPAEPEAPAPKLPDSPASAMAAAGMPIPNVPVADRESGLGRFFAAIAAMFRPSNAATPVINNQSNTPQMSTIIFPALCAALALDSLELSGDKATASLSVEQLAKIDKALNGNASEIKAKDTEIATLKARVAELEKTPAETTSAIVSTSQQPEKPESPMDAFSASVRRAREIYDQLP